MIYVDRLEIRYKPSSRACFSMSKENWRNQGQIHLPERMPNTRTHHAMVSSCLIIEIISFTRFLGLIKSLQTHNFTTIHQWNDKNISENLSINILNIKIVHIIEDWNCKFWQIIV